MAGGRARRRASLRDRRMWRLMLARLHPDAGGDPELFIFACALRDRLRGRGFASEGSGTPEPGPFPADWLGTMDSWASRNRDTLKRSRARRRASR